VVHRHAYQRRFDRRTAESPLTIACERRATGPAAGDEFICASAGVEAAPLNPLAVELMREVGIDITTQHVKDTAEALKERFAFVVSICDVSKEPNPLFPFAFRILQWDIPEPDSSSESRDQQLSHFRRTRDEIERRVRDFVRTGEEMMTEHGAAH
jgi:arsenate reductase